jgi:drug/metabolite transporter (DMT)-like permease
MSTPSASFKDYINLHFVVFLWGFTAILGKLITVTADVMVLYRTLLAAAGMGALMIFRKESFSVARADLFKLFVTGAIVAAHWLTFFFSVKLSNPSTALVGFATCSLWAALLEPIVKGKKIQFIEVLLGVVVVIGLYVIFSFDFQHPFGLFLGILSGVTVAIFGVLNSLFVKRMTPTTITFYEMVGACITTALFIGLTQNTNDINSLIPSAMDWFWIAILAFACSVYAYAVSIELMKRLSVFFIQLTLNLEPVYGIILALLIFGESEVMVWSFYLGTVIILSAVMLYPVLKASRRKTE